MITMPYILYLKNKDTGKIRQVDGVFQNDKQKGKARRALERDMKGKGYTHITVHEKKIK